MIATMGIGLYPNLVPALDVPAAEHHHRQGGVVRPDLTVMLVITAVGIPLVLAYTAFVYARFRGKVRPDEPGYGH